jgi:hypothetical protein
MLTNTELSPQSLVKLLSKTLHKEPFSDSPSSLAQSAGHKIMEKIKADFCNFPLKRCQKGKPKGKGEEVIKYDKMQNKYS